MKKTERYGVNFALCGIAVSLLSLSFSIIPNKEIALVAAVFFLTIGAIPFLIMVGENNRTKNFKGISKAIDKEPLAFYTSLLLIVPVFSIMLYKLTQATIELIIIL